VRARLHHFRDSPHVETRFAGITHRADRRPRPVGSKAGPPRLKQAGKTLSFEKTGLGASLIGILFGSAIFGWVGDRCGRKVELVSRCIASVLAGLST
jgi:hypothetical protein